MTRPRRLMLTGMFDMANFGDLLFPLVAQHRLRAHGIEVVPVAPTGNAPPLRDAMAARPISALFDEGIDCDGVAVGGGYLIHAHPLNFFETYDAGATGDWAGLGLWLGAALAAALRGVPVIWNAPGVVHPLPASLRPIIDASLRLTEYLSVRDRGAAELLQAPTDVQVNIVPDTVAGIAQLWPRADLARTALAFRRRKQVADEVPLLAVHLRLRSVAGLDPDALAADLDALAAAHGVCPVLIAVGQSHDDAALALDFSRRLRGRHIVLDDPESLQEITAVLAHARAYVGASMHGYVVASAYGVPGTLVARPSYRKFMGFLEHAGRPEDMAKDWSVAWTKAHANLRDRPEIRLPDAVDAALDSHWNRLAQSVLQPRNRKEDQAGFLARWIREGQRLGGGHWAMTPFQRGKAGAGTRVFPPLYPRPEAPQPLAQDANQGT